MKDIGDIVVIVGGLVRGLQVHSVNVFFDPQDGHGPTVTLTGQGAVGFIREIGGQASEPWRDSDDDGYDERDWLGRAHDIVWAATEQIPKPGVADVTLEAIKAVHARGEHFECPKCHFASGNDWKQCQGACPMPMSPHFQPPKVDDKRAHMALIMSIDLTEGKVHDLTAAFRMAGHQVHAELREPRRVVIFHDTDDMMALISATEWFHASGWRK